MKIHPSKRRKNSGFTLIEILVVVLIIGLLVGLVGSNVFGALLKGQKGAVKIQMRNFDQVLSQYRLEKFSYPDTLEELLEADDNGNPYMKRIPLDPWDNEYDYSLEPDGSYLLISYGKDKAPGGEGDSADIRSDEE